MPAGYSIHIGVKKPNFVAAAAVGTDVAAQRMWDEIAKVQGFQPPGKSPNVLLDEDATYAHVQTQINAVVTRLRDGDIFLLTFAGHGDRYIRAKGGVMESPGAQYDQYFHLYDRSWIDDDIFETLRRIEVRARVVMVWEACYSGSAMLNQIVHLPDAPSLRLRRLSEWRLPNPGAPIEQRFRQAAWQPLSDVGLWLRSPYGFAHEILTLPRRMIPPMSAEVLLLAACSDRVVAQPAQAARRQPQEPPPFTRELLNNWKVSNSYRDLVDNIAKCLPAEPGPVLNKTLASEGLIQERPFTI